MTFSTDSGSTDSKQDLGLCKCEAASYRINLNPIRTPAQPIPEEEEEEASVYLKVFSFLSIQLIM